MILKRLSKKKKDSCCFLIFILQSLCYYGCSEDKLTKDTILDVFGQDIQVKMISNRDLGGLDVHGDLFLYSEYKLSPLQLNGLLKVKRLEEYPSFNSGYFKDRKLLDSPFFAKWQHFPLKSMIDSSVFAATFRTSSAISVMNDEKPYLDSANYYSCINAKGPGNCFFILVPKSYKLYWIIRKG